MAHSPASPSPANTIGDAGRREDGLGEARSLDVGLCAVHVDRLRTERERHAGRRMHGRRGLRGRRRVWTGPAQRRDDDERGLHGAMPRGRRDLRALPRWRALRARTRHLAYDRCRGHLLRGRWNDRRRALQLRAGVRARAGVHADVERRRALPADVRDVRGLLVERGLRPQPLPPQPLTSSFARSRAAHLVQRVSCSAMSHSHRGATRWGARHPLPAGSRAAIARPHEARADRPLGVLGVGAGDREATCAQASTDALRESRDVRLGTHLERSAAAAQHDVHQHRGRRVRRPVRAARHGRSPRRMSHGATARLHVG